MTNLLVDPDDEHIANELRDAVAGLLYPSESDEPFDPFVWKPTETDALSQIGAQGRKTAPVMETSLDDFFAELIAGEQGQSFARLRQVLLSRLTGLRVLRIGDIEVAVYLIGKTKSGTWAGLRTVSVET
jgi:hypothetical protein